MIVRDIFSYLFFITFFSLFANIALAKNYNFLVTVPADVSQLHVSHCFDIDNSNETTSFLNVGNNTLRLTSQIKLISGDTVHTINRSSNSIKLSNIQKGDCFEYQAKLKSVIKRRLKSVDTRDQILTNPNDWLWYPKTFSEDDTIIIEFNHESGISISAPWKLISRSETITRYEIKKRPYEWDAIVAIGAFTVNDIKFGDALIRAAILKGRNNIDKSKINLWINQNIKALTTVYDEFPVASLQLLIVPLGKGGEPVPWGEVMRGGGDAVHLFIDDTQTTKQFLDDWVFSHELSHLLHPRITKDGKWLYEGLASYYQNVMRSRQGLLTSKIAWQKLHAGFERGIKNTNKTRNSKTLAEASQTMMQDRSFMRIYWSGAAMSLIADVKLRRLSNNKKSLDSVLKLFKECCLSEAKWWTAYELMKKYDELSETTVFSELYNNNVYSKKFPNLNDVYQQLGLIKKYQYLEFLQNAPSSIRQEIMK